MHKGFLSLMTCSERWICLCSKKPFWEHELVCSNWKDRDSWVLTYILGTLSKDFAGSLCLPDKAGMQQRATPHILLWCVTCSRQGKGWENLYGCESAPWQTEPSVASCFVTFYLMLLFFWQRFSLFLKDGFLLPLCLVNLSLLSPPPAISCWLSAGAPRARSHPSEWLPRNLSLARAPWMSSFCHDMTRWL